MFLDRTAIFTQNIQDKPVVVYMFFTLGLQQLPFRQDDRQTIFAEPVYNEALNRFWGQQLQRNEATFCDQFLRFFATFPLWSKNRQDLKSPTTLLFLRYTEGIMFKILPDCRDELEEIYRELREGRLEGREIQSVVEVTDPLNNSINEKCARIREVSLLKFDDHSGTLLLYRRHERTPQADCPFRKVHSVGMVLDGWMKSHGWCFLNGFYRCYSFVKLCCFRESALFFPESCASQVGRDHNGAADG